MELKSTQEFKRELSNSTSEDTGNDFVFTTSEPYKNRIVSLKRETWEEKILNLNGLNDSKRFGNSHPEMKDLLNEVERSVSEPFLIVKDTMLAEEDEDGNQIWVESPNREQNYGFYFGSTDGKMRLIKTIIEYQEDGRGEIVTTHTFHNTKRIQEEAGVLYDARRKTS